MKIAIHAADLDHKRIDGTRVYLANMLKNFGLLKSNDEFEIYHANEFNSHLAPPVLTNYQIKKIPFPWLWTQTRFAWQLFWDRPDVLWMPVHNVPILRRKSLKVVVTIHDLAFKIFPNYFPKKDLKKLNRLSDLAIKNADKLIAISQTTKNDILRFYPKVKPEKIVVINHGFDTELFSKKINIFESQLILSKFNSPAGGQNVKYLLYVGAIQPRKNLEVLIEAFEKSKKLQPELKLILAGAPAWQAEKTLAKIATSKFKQDIIVTGTLPFSELPILYQNALAFVFPSLYEGFGIPVLEAFASGAPAIVAKNSSLVEVAGDSALFFETGNAEDLAKQLAKIITDKELRVELIAKGRKRANEFSWEKCARQTLDEILN